MVRAKRRNLSEIISPVLIKSDSLDFKEFENSIDFTLLFAVIHEVPEPRIVFREIYKAMKNGGKILFAEPVGHVSIESFNNSVAIADEVGFKIKETMKISGSHSVLLEKP